MRSLAAKFVASCEELDEVVSAAPLEGGADSMEQGILDAQQVEAEVAENEQALAEAQEVATGLEAIANDLDAFAKDGGLDSKGAVMMRRAVNAYTAQLGFKTPPVASVESFGGATSRVTATVASMEGIKEIIANVWKWIKDQIQKLRNTMKDYWLKNYAVAPRLSKRAQALKARAQKATGSAKESKIEISGVLAAINIGGTVPSDIPGSYGKVKAEAERIFSTTSKDTLTAAEAFAKQVEGLSFTNDETFSEAIVIFKNDKPMADVKIGTPITGDKRHGDAEEAFGGDEIMGGVRVFASYKKYTAGDIKSVVNAIASLKAGMEPVSATPRDVSGTANVNTLSLSAVADVCDSVIGVADLIAKYAQGYANRDKSKDVILKAGDAFAKQVAGIEELATANNAIARDIATAIKAQAEMIDRPMTQFSSQIIRTSAAVLTVCEKSLGQYTAG